MNRMLRLTATFFAGSALSKLLVFALLPLYTRVLSTDEYGLYDLSITYVTIVAALLFCDIWVATMRFMYREAPGERERTAKLGLIAFALMMVAFVAVGLVTNLWLQLPHIELVLAYGVTTALKDQYGYIARGFDANGLFAASGAINTVVMVGLNLLFLLVLELGVRGLFLASIVANLVQVLLIEAIVRPATRGGWRNLQLSIFRSLLVFALPLGVNACGYWILTGVGKFFVAATLGLGENGLFAVGAKLATVVVVLYGVLTAAWQDAAFTRGSDDSQGFYRRAATYFAFACAAGTALLLPMFQISFPLLVGPDFRDVYPILPAFLVVAALGGLNSFLGNVFYALMKTAPVLITTLVGSLVSVLLSWCLIPNLGLWGANAAIAAAFSVSIAVRLTLLRRTIDIAFALGVTAVGLGLLLASTLVYSLNNSWLSAAWLVVFLCVGGLRFRRQIFQSLRRPSRPEVN